MNVKGNCNGYNGGEIERRRKRGGPSKRWWDQVEEDLNMIYWKQKAGRQWSETTGNGGRLYCKTRSTLGGRR